MNETQAVTWTRGGRLAPSEPKDMAERQRRARAVVVHNAGPGLPLKREYFVYPANAELRHRDLLFNSVKRRGRTLDLFVEGRDGELTRTSSLGTAPRTTTAERQRVAARLDGKDVSPAGRERTLRSLGVKESVVERHRRNVAKNKPYDAKRAARQKFVDSLRNV